MKKKIIGIISICILGMGMCACHSRENAVQKTELEEQTPDSPQKTNIDFVNKEIDIPDLSKQYKLIIVNDQHVIVANGDYVADKSEEINQRIALFSDADGKTSSETWPEIVDAINVEKPDGVILNGDMVDFFSEANLNCLMDGVKRIDAPVMYNRADHDLGIWYSDTYTDEDVQQREKKAWEMEDVMVQDFDEFIVVGINNNTSQLSEVGLQKVKEIWAEGYGG